MQSECSDLNTLVHKTLLCTLFIAHVLTMQGFMHIKLYFFSKSGPTKFFDDVMEFGSSWTYWCFDNCGYIDLIILHYFINIPFCISHRLYTKRHKQQAIETTQKINIFITPSYSMIMSLPLYLLPSLPPLSLFSFDFLNPPPNNHKQNFSTDIAVLMVQNISSSKKLLFFILEDANKMRIGQQLHLNLIVFKKA